MFVGHFGDPLSNFLVPLNIFGTDEGTHLKFDSLWQVLAYGGYFQHTGMCTALVGQQQLNWIELSGQVEHEVDV